MIGFLYPLLGLAALAVAVPIVLHLMRRREVRRVVFPAIRYLRRAERRHARRLRVRHLVLLAARVSIILLLAIAAAGPLVGRGGPEDHRPTALAIVIDESQSSTQLQGERRLLDLYVERARLGLELAGGDDRVAVFSAVRPDMAALTDAAAAVDYLSDLRPTAGLADLDGAIRQAEAWLASSAADRALEIHVFTDLQRVSLPATRPEGLSSDGGDGVSVLVYTPVDAPEPNGAPGTPEPEVEPLDAARQATIAVPLQWFGQDAPGEPTVVRLITDDDVIAVAEASFGGPALLQMPPQGSGWIQGYVEIDVSGLAADDRRYFTWFARPPARVAVTGNPGEFAVHALQALADGGRVSLVGPENAEVWVAGDGDRIEEGLGMGVSVIVVPPSNPLDLPRLNSRLSRARIPWRYEPEGPESGASRIADGSPVEGISGLEVRRLYRLVPSGLAAADSTLLRLAGGEAWLVRGTVAQGVAYLLIASPLTPEATDLPVSAGMVPLVDAAVGDWARRGAIESGAATGSTPVRLPPRARQIQGPDGSQAPVEGGGWFQATEAGNYIVLDGEQVLAAFSVNAPVAEADLERGDPGELEAALPAARWTWSRDASPAEWRDDIFRARRGMLAWRPLVVLLIALSIVETFIAAAGRRTAPLPGRQIRRKQAPIRELSQHK
jgi:hypothetical protein